MIKNKHKYFFFPVFLSSIIITKPQENEKAIKEYEKLVKLYGLVEPYQWESGSKILPLANFTHCSCPRVYYPVCAVNDVTYVNACVMKCVLNKPARRDGPCIMYRKSGNAKVSIALPEEWSKDSVTSIISKPVSLVHIVFK